MVKVHNYTAYFEKKEDKPEKQPAKKQQNNPVKAAKKPMKPYFQEEEIGL